MIREVTVSVRPDRQTDGYYRLLVEVVTNGKSHGAQSSVIMNDDFKSHFDMILDECKRLILREIETP